MSHNRHAARHLRRSFPVDWLSVLSLLVVLGTPPIAWSQPTAATRTESGPADSLDRDYAKELPRIPARSPADALQSFVVAPGFRVELVAAEPLVTDPVAIDFDADLRMYVVEMRGYSEDGEKNLGRIRRLTDRDGDGTYDEAVTFVDGLSWPTGILCYDGGVFVAAAPDLWYFKDTDGDGKADRRERVYTGFARSNVQGLLNSFRWGLDNRIHAATSSSGAVVKRPGVAGFEPVALRGRDFAFDPRTKELEATSGGGQHGMTFNRWGDKFVCSNSNHLQQVMFEDRYVARNPYLSAPSPRLMIAADGPQAEVYRASPVEPWRIVRTRLRVKGIVPGPVEGGGRAAGYFTSATGLTIYKGSAWPANMRGIAVVGDVGSNIVHRKRLERADNALHFTGKRIDEKSEFVASRDIWFRPVQFANAPDGTLYIIDMYREVIEHPASLPPIIKKHLDLTSGRNRGRIYRIVSAEGRKVETKPLSRMPTAQLVELLAHPNGWHRTTAARLLFERRDLTAVPLLITLAERSPRPEARMLALYALRSLNALNDDTLMIGLWDKDPHVRVHALRVAEAKLADSPVLRSRVAVLANDPDVRVRYQAAFTLGELPVNLKVKPLVGLIRSDGQNKWIALAVQSSLAEGCGAVLAMLLEDAARSRTPAGKTWIRRLAAQIGKQQRADDVAAVIRLVGDPNTVPDSLAELLRGLQPKPDTPLAKELAAMQGGAARETVKRLVDQAVAVLHREGAGQSARLDAIGALSLSSFAQQRDLFASLLAPTQSREIQQAALATLAQYDDPNAGRLILDHWSGFSPRVRQQAGDVLASRTAWAIQLLDAVAARRIPLADVSTTRLQALAGHADGAVRERAKKLLAQTLNPDRAAVVQRYRKALERKGNPTRGAAVFKKQCASCHRVNGVGHEIGPNLAAMRNRGAEAILVNVLDPNREVNPQYLNYIVQLADGRVLNGIIASETATGITLRRADNATDAVLRIDIEGLKSTGQSLMPEGLEKEIDIQAMADLIAFLMQS